MSQRGVNFLSLALFKVYPPANTSGSSYVTTFASANNGNIFVKDKKDGKDHSTTI